MDYYLGADGLKYCSVCDWPLEAYVLGEKRRKGCFRMLNKLALQQQAEDEQKRKKRLQSLLSSACPSYRHIGEIVRENSMAIHFIDDFRTKYVKKTLQKREN